MKAEGKSTRFHERTRLEIPLRIFYKFDAENEWSEETVTEQATICGVGFRLARPVELNRLARLELPMPKNLRLYDFNKPLYEVWAVVSNIQVVQSEIADRINLKIGAALIGDKPSSSFLENPETLYDLKPVLRNRCFWEIRELPRKSGPYRRSFEDRREIVEKIILEAIDETGKILETVEAETLNISESGAAVVAKLKTENPKYFLVGKIEENIVIFAVARGVRQLEQENFLRLHLEFISGKWTF